MKNRILFLVFALVALPVTMISCNKGKDDAVSPTTPVSSSCRQAYIASADDSVVYSYDGQNRLIEVDAYTNKHELFGVIKYVYTSTQVVRTTYDAHNIPSDTAYYYLNPGGRVNYAIENDSNFSVNGFEGMQRNTTYYTYDADGYNTRQIIKHAFKGKNTYDTILFTYSGGNMISANYLNVPDVITYTYMTQEDKLGINVIPYEPDLFGKANKNLIASLKNTDNSLHATMAYEFDADGYTTRYKADLTSYGDNEKQDYRIVKTCK